MKSGNKRPGQKAAGSRHRLCSRSGSAPPQKDDLKALLGVCPGLVRDLDLVSGSDIVGKLVKVQVAVGVGGSSVELCGVLEVLGRCGELAEDGGDSSELGRGEVDVCSLAEAVGEVTCRGGDDSGGVADAGLVAHAEGAARHLHPGSRLSKDRVVALGRELRSVHLGGGGDPQAGGDGTSLVAVEEFAGGAEVPNVGHARPDENLVNLLAGDGGEKASIIGVVGGTEDRFLDLIQVDFNHLVVLGSLVSLHQDGISDPLLHGCDAALQGLDSAVTLLDHPLEHHDVALEVLDDGLGAQLDGAASRRTLSRGIRELECLLDLEVGKALNLEDAAREDILFALLLHGEETTLDRGVGDGVHEVA